MRTFVYRLWKSSQILSVKAWDYDHAMNKVRKIHKTNDFTVEFQMPVRNWA